MAQDDPQPLSIGRMALLGAYVALERDSPRKGEYSLESDLRAIGVDFGESLDAYSQLQIAAENLDQRGRPSIHRLQLAFAAMEVMQRAPRDDFREPLRPVAAQLVDPGRLSFDDGTDPVDAVQSALERVARSRISEEQRWAQVNKAVGMYLRPELAATKNAWCRSELRSLDDEMVSRVETRLVVESPRPLQQIVPAVLPQNWPQCNDFFCSLIRNPAHDPFGATGGDLSADTVQRWRGVYEERVGGCPSGWFPDTFLFCTWDRNENQLILRYELAPRRSGDRTVLKIDQGYIQVDRFADTYEVSTLKYLLFDDQFISGGGQVLGQSACQLGWLDYAINQFSDCAAALSGSSDQLPPVPGDADPAGEPGPNLDAGLQEALDRCEDHLLESATSAEAQLSMIRDKVNSGKYGLNDFVGDWGQAAVRAIRDGARVMQSQIDYAMESLRLAQRLLRGRNTRS